MKRDEGRSLSTTVMGLNWTEVDEINVQGWDGVDGRQVQASCFDKG